MPRSFRVEGLQHALQTAGASTRRAESSKSPGALRAVLCDVIGEPVKQSAKFIGEPRKSTGKPELRITLPESAGAPQAKGKESELAKREADVAAREAELKRWEADLRSSGRLEAVKNWPKCCPITNMDIAGEVPEGLQNVVTCAYWSYLVRAAPRP